VELQQFKRYNFDEQYRILQQHGTFLMTRSTEEAWVVLFTLYSFYVEVIQDKTNGELCYIRSFTDIALLEPYLSQINISPILND
jgi:hypothetical protein